MAATNWIIDLEHSEIHFKIRHLLISNITGAFTIFAGKMINPEHDVFEGSSFSMKIDVYSVTTNNVERDEHLKSEDFFDADKYPDIRFNSTSFEHIEGDNYELKGNLTIKGITKPVTLDVLFGGQAKDGFGNDRAGFEINGEINRNDFDIHSPEVDEAGGLLFGEDIKVHANIQYIHER